MIHIQQQHLNQQKFNNSSEMLVLGTAHPCKFPDAVKEATESNQKFQKVKKYFKQERKLC